MAARLDDFVSEHGRRPSPRPSRRARRRGVGHIVVAAVTTVLCLARAFARRRTNVVVPVPA